MKLNLMSLTAALAVMLAFAQTAQARDHKQGRGVYHVAGNGKFGDRNHGQPFSYGANDAFAWNAQGAYQGRDVRRAQNTYRVRNAYSRGARVSRAERRSSRAHVSDPHRVSDEAHASGADQSLSGTVRAAGAELVSGRIGRSPARLVRLAHASGGRRRIRADSSISRATGRTGAVPGPAGIGAVVVWSHHVGKIVGQENGQ